MTDGVLWCRPAGPGPATPATRRIDLYGPLRRRAMKKRVSMSNSSASSRTSRSSDSPPLPRRGGDRLGRGMAPDLAHVESWIFDLDNSLYPRGSQPVRADRRQRMGDYIQRLLGLRSGRGAAGAEGLFPRPRHHARRADGRAWRRSARLPRFRPRHRSRPARPPIRRWSRRWTGCRAASSSSPTPSEAMPRRVLDRLGLANAFDGDARHPRHGLCAQARSLAPMRRSASGTASIPTRALFADDMVRNLAPGQGARHDHVVGRQRLGAGPRSTPSPTFVDYRIARYRRLARTRSWERKWHDATFEHVDRRGLGGARRTRHRDRGRGPRRRSTQAIAPAR